MVIQTNGTLIDENVIKNLFGEFLKYVREKDISYIEICDRDQGYIFIKKVSFIKSLSYL